MSYHLKFRFILAVLMAAAFAAMTPWMSRSSTPPPRQADTTDASMFTVRETSDFAGQINRASIDAQVVALGDR